MGGVRLSREAPGYFRISYRSVSSIYLLSPDEPFAALGLNGATRRQHVCLVGRPRVQKCRGVACAEKQNPSFEELFMCKAGAIWSEFSLRTTIHRC